MSETVITIPTDAATAAKYYAASDMERQKIQILLRVLLQSPAPSTQSLVQLMDDISDEAQSRGLTPDILNSILNDDDDDHA